MDVNRFISDVPNYFTCTICQGIVINPVEHTLCDAIFCEKCIRFSIEEAGLSSGSCPNCQSVIDYSPSIASSTYSSTLRPLNRHLKCIYDELILRCQFYPRCDTMYTLAENGIHTSECDFVKVQCAYQGCIYEGERHTLAAHVKDCPFRPVFCQYCDQEVAFCHVIEHHNSECPDLPMHCYRCQFALKRRELEEHNVQYCPLSIICCTIPGCHTQCIRDQLSEHLEEDAVKHMHLLLALVECQKEEIAMLKLHVATPIETEQTIGSASAAPAVVTPSTPTTSNTPRVASGSGGRTNNVPSLPISRVVSFERKSSFTASSRSNSSDALAHLPQTYGNVAGPCGGSSHNNISMNTLVAPVLIGDSNMSISHPPREPVSSYTTTAASAATALFGIASQTSTPVTPSSTGSGVSVTNNPVVSSPITYTFNNRKYVVRDGLLFDEEYQCHLRSCRNCLYTRPDNLMQRFYSGFRPESEDILSLVANRETWLCSKCAPVTRSYSFSSSDRLNSMT